MKKVYSHLERTWVRPTLELNGIFGGFSGEGIKTVLPAEAGAKITCRLVPDQDPDEIVAKLKAHIEKHKPVGVTVTVTEFDKGKPFITPFDHPAIQAAGRCMKKCIMCRLLIRVVEDLFQSLQHLMKFLELPVVLMGFGLSSENFHAPNEHFHLENFDQGLRVIGDYYYEIAELSKEDFKK